MTRHQRNLAIAGDFETSRESTAFEATGEEADTTTAVPAINEASDLKPTCGGSDADACQDMPRRINVSRDIRIATWNVQSLYQAGKLCNVVNEMNRSGISVLGIADARWTESGHFTAASGELVIYSGGTTHQAGVAVILANHVKASLIGYKTISDRLLYVRIWASPYNISLCQVYAPFL